MSQQSLEVIKANATLFLEENQFEDVKCLIKDYIINEQGWT